MISRHLLMAGMLGGAVTLPYLTSSDFRSSGGKTTAEAGTAEHGDYASNAAGSARTLPCGREPRLAQLPPAQIAAITRQPELPSATRPAWTWRRC